MFSNDDLRQILQTSRHNNETRQISGILLYKGGNVMQVLEGAPDSVLPLFAKISKDPRHKNVIILAEGPIRSREFDGWHMGFVNFDDMSEEDLEGYSSFLTEDGFDANFIKSSPTQAYVLLSNFKSVNNSM